MPIRRLSRDEIGQRGTCIYHDQLRSLLKNGCCGRFVAINVETEEYEVANESTDAADKLYSRDPDAQIFVERIGYPVAFHAYRASCTD